LRHELVLRFLARRRGSAIAPLGAHDSPRGAWAPGLAMCVFQRDVEQVLCPDSCLLRKCHPGYCLAALGCRIVGRPPPPIPLISRKREAPLVSSIADRGVAESRALEAAQRGDTSAFNELVLIYQTAVYNVALRTLGHSEDAADATQET